MKPNDSLERPQPQRGFVYDAGSLGRSGRSRWRALTHDNAQHPLHRHGGLGSALSGVRKD